MTVQAELTPTAAPDPCGDDGSWVFKGRFTPEQGALISKALDAAMEQQFSEQKNVPDDVSAETSRSLPLDRRVPQGIVSRSADAMQQLAEAFLSREAGNASSGSEAHSVAVERGRIPPAANLSANHR